MMFGAFDVSASALTAQRVRLDTISSNIANFDSTDAGLGADGKPQPYRRLFTIFQAERSDDGNAGVRVKSIEEDQSPFNEKYEPWNSRFADANGYVKYPNVDLFTESANALEATRAYEANITTIETTKSMMGATLRVLS
ncbi:MAG TPA: flagellar basal body rod protein FlgC [Phycisphaerae bacterium]|jgi:flagellar basal-body rod protein FlgC